MSTSKPAAIGTIGWLDLTTPNAPHLRDFYASVCGWSVSETDMGGYSDFCMHAPDRTTVAGICHKQGVNADVPTCWLPYVVVANLTTSLTHVRSHGGKVLREPTTMGESGTMAIIQDPEGAYMALVEPAP